jgi:hypothetical protein
MGWDGEKHRLTPQGVIAKAQRRFGLERSPQTPSKGGRFLPIPMTAECEMWRKRNNRSACNGWGMTHSISWKDVYDHAVNELKMQPPAAFTTTVIKEVEVQVEVVREVPVEVGLDLSLEEREIMSFAFQREWYATTDELKYVQGSEALELAGRLRTLEALRARIGLEPIGGRPTWNLARTDISPKLFDEADLLKRFRRYGKITRAPRGKEKSDVL